MSTEIYVEWLMMCQEDHKPVSESNSNDLVQPACFSCLPLLNIILCAFVIQINY
jgi:hypothetical protein